VIKYIDDNDEAFNPKCIAKSYEKVNLIIFN